MMSFGIPQRWSRTGLGIAICILTGLLLLGFSPSEASTQGREVRVRIPQESVVQSTARGWLGVAVHSVLNYSSDGEEWSQIWVTNVREDGPAYSAGLRAGDILTYIDGQPLTINRFRALNVSRSPGESVRLGYQRHGSSRDVVVRLGRRPDTLPIPRGEFRIVQIEISGDLPGTVVGIRDGGGITIAQQSSGKVVESEVIELSTDSTQIQVRFGLTGSARSADEEALNSENSTRVTVGTLDKRLEAWTQRSPSADSLTQFLSTQRLEIAPDSLMWSRLYPLPTVPLLMLRQPSFVDNWGLDYAPDNWGAEAPLSDVADRTTPETLFGGSDEEAILFSQFEDRRTAAENTEALTLYRLNPLLSGRNMAAGAELAELNPALRGVFGTSRGVLVTEVVEGTLASDAGLRGGDVIQSVNGVLVRTVREFRETLLRAAQPAELGLIRKGEELVMTLREE